MGSTGVFNAIHYYKWYPPVFSNLIHFKFFGCFNAIDPVLQTESFQL